MKLTVTACLALILGLALFGWYERSQGVQQAEARAHADSLLHADSVNQALVTRRDSIASKVAQDSLQRLNLALRASQQRRAASQAHADSLAGAIQGDSLVPRDTVVALVAAFRSERQAADSQIATLTTANAILTAEVAGKDSTIRALNLELDGERRQLRAALQPPGRSLLSHALDLGVKILAVRGAVAFVFGK